MSPTPSLCPLGCERSRERHAGWTGITATRGVLTAALLAFVPQATTHSSSSSASFFLADAACFFANFSSYLSLFGLSLQLVAMCPTMPQ